MTLILEGLDGVQKMSKFVPAPTPSVFTMTAVRDVQQADVDLRRADGEYWTFLNRPSRLRRLPP